MAEQAGGNIRFRGPGSQWKTSWKGRQMFSELCCVQGFGSDLAGQSYENTNGPLSIIPANGFFLGVVLGVSTVPGSPQLIASNGNVANEGWRLTMFSQLTADGQPGVGFNFTFFDGAGAALALITSDGTALYTAEQAQLLGPARIISLLVGLEPPSGSFPNGEAAMVAGESDASGVLGSVYVNSAPYLRVGRDGADVYEAPNCIAGIVGGEALFTEGQVVAQVGELKEQWDDAIVAAGGVVEVPDTFVPGTSNQNGWRITEGGAGIVAPNPLPDFVDAEPLVYANVQPIADDLAAGCISPLVLGPLSYPYVND